MFTLPISNTENPPIKRPDADPEAYLAPLIDALMETDISGFMSFDLGIERTKCSGE